MTDPGRRFDPAELNPTDGPALTEPERLAAGAIARELKTVAARHGGVGEDFTDRVMAAIATEPNPQPVIAFGSAVRSGRVRGSLAAVRDAWRVALGAGRPLALRGQAFALALVVLVGVLGVTGGAAVGAARLLAPDISPSPSPTDPIPTPSPTLDPSPSPSPSPPEATGTPEPTETPEAPDDHGGDRTPRATDDSSGPGSGGSGGDSSGSGSGSGGDDSSGSGSGSDDEDSSGSGSGGDSSGAGSGD